MNSLNSLRRGVWAAALGSLTRLAASGARCDIIGVSAAVSAAEKGSWPLAVELFGFVRPNVVLCNAACSAFEMATEWLKALDLFTSIRMRSLRADLLSSGARKFKGLGHIA